MIRSLDRFSSLLPALCFGATAFAQAPVESAMKRYCTGCHSTQMKAGSLVLEGIASEPVERHPEQWEKVVKRLRVRSMPPVGMPRPDEKAYSLLIASIAGDLDKVAVAKPDPGRIDTFRRLNRTEYRNAIRDLLALDVDVSNLLPGDESSHGFDNITVGDLSPTLLERYLSAASKISRLAVGIAPRAPGGETVNLPPDLTQEKHFDGLPFGTRGGLIVPYTLPVNGTYEIQIRLQRDRNEHVEGMYVDHQLELTIDGERAQLFTVKPPPPGKDHSQVDTALNAKLELKAGPHKIGAAFLKQSGAMLETERRPYEANFNMDRHPRPQPAVFSVSVNGPYGPTSAGNTPSRQHIFVCRPGNAGEEDACAKRIVSALARRAYRRPVTDADVQKPFRFFKEARAAGSFDDGIEMALRAVLVSPEFLFRVEQDPVGIAPKTSYPISDLALATRLSFFLWSSIPDDELLTVAEKGTLRNPAVLEKQVRRMLADSRSQVLVTNFAEQWLYLRNIASSTPDMRLFADFDDNLRRSFRKETELFFESIIREDRSILDLLRANYTYLDERLAKHYGIPNVYGSRFRRVTFPDGGNVRGGLLRQGSILTVTSYATRTSPVLRGKWIMDNLMGVPPPPPPAVVPALKEKSSAGKNLSIREKMAEHRDNPACSGCHQLMDPVGFALENYDAIGRWRTMDDMFPVDNAGGLPDGSKFSGVSGLQKAILNRPEVFATTFTEKLLTYALGRGVAANDAPAIRKIVRDAEAKDFKFSSFIAGIAASTPFQMRRSE